MSPIEILVTEHRLLEGLLDAMERWAGEPGAGDRDTLGWFVRVLLDYVDPVHHGKEEEILFATMVEHGFPRQFGPIAVMLDEHEQARALVHQLEDLAKPGGAWGDQQRAAAADTARAYAGLMRQHVHKENEVLYPMAESRLNGAVMDAIGARFEQFTADRVTPARRELLARAEQLAGAGSPRGGA